MATLANACDPITFLLATTKSRWTFSSTSSSVAVATRTSAKTTIYLAALLLDSLLVDIAILFDPSA